MSDTALLARLREPVADGFDYEQDGLHLAAAARIEELLTQLGTEQEMHKAWRKRAEEAEAALNSHGSPAATPESRPLGWVVVGRPYWSPELGVLMRCAADHQKPWTRKDAESEAERCRHNPPYQVTWTVEPVGGTGDPYPDSDGTCSTCGGPVYGMNPDLVEMLIAHTREMPLGVSTKALMLEAARSLRGMVGELRRLRASPGGEPRPWTPRNRPCATCGGWPRCDCPEPANDDYDAAKALAWLEASGGHTLCYYAPRRWECGWGIFPTPLDALVFAMRDEHGKEDYCGAIRPSDGEEGVVVRCKRPSGHAHDWHWGWRTDSEDVTWPVEPVGAAPEEKPSVEEFGAGPIQEAFGSPLLHDKSAPVPPVGLADAASRSSAGGDLVGAKGARLDEGEPTHTDWLNWLEAYMDAVVDGEEVLPINAGQADHLRFVLADLRSAGGPLAGEREAVAILLHDADAERDIDDMGLAAYYPLADRILSALSRTPEGEERELSEVERVLADLPSDFAGICGNRYDPEGSKAYNAAQDLYARLTALRTPAEPSEPGERVEGWLEAHNEQVGVWVVRRRSDWSKRPVVLTLLPPVADTPRRGE